MKAIKSYCHLLLSVFAVTACLNSNAGAQPVVSLQRTGALNIYKGSAAYNTTTFTVTASPAPTSEIEVYIYLGGQGDAFCGTCMSESPNNCTGFAGDFSVSGPGVSAVTVVPNLYEIDIPAGHTSAVITVTALTNANSCGDPDGPNLLVKIPGTSDYTQNEYTVNGSAQSANAYVWESDQAPNVTLNVSANANPAYFYKNYQNSVTFTLTANQPFPAAKTVVFLIGGDGTDDSEGDPCFASYPTDFSVSGANTVPINNGFSVGFNEGDTSKSFTVTAVSNSITCEVLGFQPLYVTVVNWGASYGYGPGSTGQLVGRIYPSM